ncbi:MAG: hypothetical protein LBI14_05600 [Treponema sp.]|nr:hypothetical protein [Treponema sp.]
MKKFLVFLLFLLIIGGVGFFFGWVQLDVPPGSYGVMRSKTHGTDANIIKEGDFRWCWYKLIPTNVQIKVFSVSQVQHTVNSSGLLPSGKVYAAFAGINNDFQWEVTGDFSFSVKAEALPDLTQTYNLNDQDDLIKLEEDFARRLEIFIINRLITFGEDQKEMEAILLYNSYDELISEIEAAFPELENISCYIQAVQIPDYGLYAVLKSVYNEYLAFQNSVLEEDAVRYAGARVEVRLKLDELERYGEILTRYPILLQYLALEKGFMLD